MPRGKTSKLPNESFAADLRLQTAQLTLRPKTASCAFRPFTGPILKVAFGSIPAIWPTNGWGAKREIRPLAVEPLNQRDER